MQLPGAALPSPAPTVPVAPSLPPAAPPPAANPLLTGPILPTLLRLAVPNVLSMTMAVLVGIAETWYIGLLGTEPLAAMALVFPFAMLTGMMSAGAMGGGVSSAISRALGAGDLARANTLAQHAAVIGAGAGAVYTVLIIAAGPWLYHLLGGRAEVLAQAIDYANVLFCGAILVWLSNCLASILRGSGNMRVPSVVILATSALQIVLGGLLGLGAGPVPRLGMIGVAWGHILATATAVAFLYWYLATGQGRLRLVLRDLRLQWPMFADILKVGALACLSPVQSVLAVLVFTGLVARLGVLPLAGYGIGQRLEFLLIPIAFGIGVAAFPEGHPETPNTLRLMDHLRAKVDAGADWICTQLFFDNHAFLDWRERCDIAGIRVPICAGIMPVLSVANLHRMADLAACTHIPAKLMRALQRCGDDAEGVERVGIHWATEQCLELLDRSVRGIHFYTLNRSAATQEIFRNLGLKSAAGIR